MVVAFKGRDASTFAAVDYNEKKVAERHAYRAAMYNFGKIGEKDIHSARVIKKYLQKIADKNGSNHRPQKHMILSYPGKASPEETERIVRQAHQLLDLLGYAGQPQAIYVHNDTNHTHIHCVTCTVDRRTGQTINQSNEGIRARRIIDQIRGVKHTDVLERLCDYNYESRQQLMNLLWNNGYQYANIDEDSGKIVIPPFHYSNRLDVPVNEIDLADVDRHIVECGKNKDNFEQRAKQLKQILLKYRRESLDYLVDTPPEKVRTKYGGTHTATQFLNQFRYGKFKGSNHLDMEDVRKEQLKMLLVKLKRELGIQIVFNEWKDGQVKGYTIIDHSGGGKGDRHHGIVWKGSDILNLQQFLNPDWKKGQETDAVISARDATEAAKEIAPNPNSTRDEIATILEAYGIDFETDNIPEEYFGETPETNRELARQYAGFVGDLEGQQAVDCARKAYAHACAADLQESMKKSGQNPVRRKEAEKFTGDREGMTPASVLDYILRTLDERGIGHPTAEKAYRKVMYDSFELRGGLNPESMSSGEFTVRAVSRLEKAVNGRGLNPEDTDYAVGYAVVAQRLAQMEAQRRQAADKADGVTLDRQESQGQQEPSQPLPFVDLHAEVRDGQIIAHIDDTEHTADLHPMHQAWYDRQEDKREAANALAMHYFPREIYEAQIYNYRQYFIDHGEMPQDIKVKDPFVRENPETHDTVLNSWFVYPDRYRTSKRQAMILPKDLVIAHRHSKYTPEQMAVRHLGMRALKEKEARPRTFSQVREQAREQEPGFTNAAWETPEAVSETANVFEGISETLAGLAAATFGLAVGAGARASAGGGGGGTGSGWRGKRDPDDWRHYDLFGSVGRKNQLKR